MLEHLERISVVKTITYRLILQYCEVAGVRCIIVHDLINTVYDLIKADWIM